MAVTTKTNGGDVAAMEQMAFLASLSATPRGAIVKARRREENPALTNADIINFQRDGKIPRDITPNDDDSDASGALFAKRVENRLRILSKPKASRMIKRGKRAGMIKPKKEIVDSVAASGFRAAGKLVSARLEERINLQKDNEGNALRPPTSSEYAAWREDEFGVPPSEALEASGQLLNDLTSAQIRIVKNPSLLASITTGAEDIASVKGAFK